jgi:hypothetical protein
MVYKPRKSNLVADALSNLSTSNELSGVPNKVVDVPLFLLQLVWLKEIQNYLQRRDFEFCMHLNRNKN